MKRRYFIRATVALYVWLHPFRHAMAQSKSMAKTPWDYEGPFYPVGAPNKTNDLILSAPKAKVLQLKGRITDTATPDPSGLRIEIWQTDPGGEYKHPRDRRSNKLWDDFLYWGEHITDKSGNFHFRTYLPSAYGGRPAHIHYKVWRQDKLLLTSQFYFHETGGTKGASKNPQLASLQTSSLVKNATGDFTTLVSVVI